MRSPGVARLLHEHLEIAVVSSYASHGQPPIDVACTPGSRRHRTATVPDERCAPRSDPVLIWLATVAGLTRSTQGVRDYIGSVIGRWLGE